MAKDYSSYDFKPSVLLPGTLKRNGAWPLDMSALFLSVDDAMKYAKGDVDVLDDDENTDGDGPGADAHKQALEPQPEQRA